MSHALKSLRSLPSYLGVATPLDTPPPPDSTCPICWNPFRPSLDLQPDQTDDQPCTPLIQPQCDHLVCNTCYAQLRKTGFLACPLCTRKPTGPVPRWIVNRLESNRPSRWPFSYVWIQPGEWLDAIDQDRYSMDRDIRKQAAEIRRLCVRLDCGTLSLVDAYRLWMLHMFKPCVTLYFCLHLLLVGDVVSRAIFMAMGVIAYGESYVALLFGALIGYIWILSRINEDDMLSAWMLGLLTVWGLLVFADWGWTAVSVSLLLLWAGHMLEYAFMVAVLIFLGIWHRKALQVHAQPSEEANASEA